MLFEVPLLRRVIQDILVFDHGFEPQIVTAAMTAFKTGTSPEVVHEEVQIDGEVCDLYTSRRRAASNEIDALSALYRERNRALSSETLKIAGERYVRAAMIQTGRYERVTQESRLGRLVNSEGDHALDILATDRKTGTRVGVSVKNTGAWMFGGNPAFADVYTKAYTGHNVAPKIVASFISNDGSKRCERDGISHAMLGAQIVPAEIDKRPTRYVIDDLRPVLGPRPYRFVPERAGRAEFPADLLARL
jgi:hypothetical protein